MFYVKVNSTLYPATVDGKVNDREWDNRESKSITLDGTFATVDALFPDGTAWSIVNMNNVPVFETDAEGNIVFNENGVPTPVLDENGEQVYESQQTEYDNSEFYIRGDLTVHTDGTCTVKMGKPTDLEDAYEILYGGM